MNIANTTESRRNLIGALAALPLTALVLGIIYSATGLIG